jgi:hypothetical protein
MTALTYYGPEPGRYETPMQTCHLTMTLEYAESFHPLCIDDLIHNKICMSLSQVITNIQFNIFVWVRDKWFNKFSSRIIYRFKTNGIKYPAAYFGCQEFVAYVMF